VNCRVNEEKVFPSPKVSEVLQRHFIEARLHTDGETNIERILELQQELAKSVATPYYLIQDPKSKRVLDKPLGGVTSVENFHGLLERAVESKERVGRLEER
jgi:hypothetical protein